MAHCAVRALAVCKHASSGAILLGDAYAAGSSPTWAGKSQRDFLYRLSPFNFATTTLAKYHIYISRYIDFFTCNTARTGYTHYL